MAISIDGISMNNLNNLISDSSLVKNDKTDTFSDVLSAMMSSIDETNDLQNSAEQESIRFALGESKPLGTIQTHIFPIPNGIPIRSNSKK